MNPRYLIFQKNTCSSLSDNSEEFYEALTEDHSFVNGFKKNLNSRHFFLFQRIFEFFFAKRSAQTFLSEYAEKVT